MKSELIFVIFMYGTDKNPNISNFVTAKAIRPFLDGGKCHTYEINTILEQPFSTIFETDNYSILKFGH